VAAQRLRPVILPALAGLAAAIGCGGGTGPSAHPTPPFAAVSAGGLHTCGLTAAGVAYCWGYNGFGQLGDGTTTDRSTPVLVAAPAGVSFAAVSAGLRHTCGLTAAGVAYCWGYNGFGQLGDGTTTDRSTSVRVAGGVSFATVSAGEGHTCGVTAAGAAYCWGDNFFGELGDGTTTSRSSPVLVAAPAGVSFATVSAGSGHTCGVTAAGAAYCWGWNASGQLGDGPTTSRSSPVLVAAPAGVSFAAVRADYSYTCGLTAAGAAYCWGDNTSGQLGDGTTTSRSGPVLVAAPAGVSFAAVSGGAEVFHTCGVTAAGAAYCWGDNFFGQLGDGTTTNRSSPVLVVGGVSFAAVSAGWRHTCGVTAAGAAYCWGDNTSGQLGDGTTTQRLTPVRVQ